ncbi:MAG: DUF2721 domain-containing protein [Chloroflexi bacterium]|nr:DUF2721 domain-containing protein [Chloroflexota bacterium]
MLNTALWLTPLVLLPGVALLVMSTSIRYGQIHSEFHHLLLEDEPEEAKIIADHLLSRSILFRNALVSLYLSVGLFAVASLIGGVASMVASSADWIVILLSFLGILCLVFASVELIRESTSSLKIVRQHHEEITQRPS